jgi:hypothetical protein
MHYVPRRILRRTGPFAALVATLALMLVPSASSQGGPPYADAGGDSSSAGDVTGVTVQGDKTSGQVIFRIAGANLSTAGNMLTFLVVDSDANPASGNPNWNGADYLFAVDDSTFEFDHWDGSDWVAAPYTTVRICCKGGGSNVMFSVNKSELGNTSEFNFTVGTVNIDTRARDDAPDDGMFNYSFDAGGPDIQGVMLQTTPSAGPRHGKAFVVKPIGLKLPADGSLASIPPQPESYSCRATISGRAVAGTGAGGCTLRIAKRNTRGKKLNVVVTVTYQGATKNVPFTFVVS